MNIVRFKNGNPLDEDTLNAPIAQIEKALTDLTNYTENIVRPTYTAIYNAVSSYDVNIGDIVYYSSEGFIAKAKAVYSTTFGNNGELLADEASYPIGMVSEKSGHSVTVILNGTFKPEQTLLSSLAARGLDNPGDYFLSATAGMISKTPAAMPVKLFSYSVDGHITFNIGDPPTNYHKHTYTNLNKGWLTSSGTLKSGFEYNYIYNITEDQATYNIVNNYGNSYIFVYDGKINISDFVCYDGNIYCSISPDSDKDCLLFTNLPCIKDQPILRAIHSASPRLNISEQHGVITLSLDNYTETDVVSNSSTAISKITQDGTIERTNVISEIITDDSMTCIKGSNGAVTLTLDGSSKILYPDITSLDLSIVTTINNKIIYSFPQGLASSILGRIHLPKPPDGFIYSISPFIEPVGINGEFSLSLFADIEFVQMSTEDNAVNIITDKLSITKIPFSENIEAQQKYFIKSQQNTITCPYAGDVYVRVYATNPYTTMSLSGFGIIATIEKA